MKNIVCVDLRISDGKSLDKVAQSVNTDFNQLLEFKKLGFVKVWIDLNGEYYVATQKRNEDISVKPMYCPISKREVKSLLKMIPVNLKVKVAATKSGDVKVDLKLDIDSILDKISASGMNSLVKEELDFLKNLSK